MTHFWPDDLGLRVKGYGDELISLRRDLHAHPELGRGEVRTTRIVRTRLEAAGLRPEVLPGGTGLVCDIGQGGPMIALRGDIDALPVEDEKQVPYRSTVPGVCHACGHDVHTAALLGAGLVLADLAREERLRRPVRLIFQPAEEVMPGGALDVIAAGGLDDVDQIVALHCDPRLEAGLVGLRSGPVTAACDRLTVRLSGPGGHTARPHLTADLVHALAKIVTELPATLSRRVDPRSGLSVVFGRVSAGSTANAIPRAGQADGTVRCLDLDGWRRAPALIEDLIRAVTGQYGVVTEVEYQRGVPPVVNEPDSTALLRTAAHAEFGAHAVVTTEQSLGGEDFAWYLEHVPGALARLGVRRCDDSDTRDIHQGSFDVDEESIETGARLLAAAALHSFSA
ncbi:MAG: amidohydrolase [Carbonactinosporaceae bacterium]